MCLNEFLCQLYQWHDRCHSGELTSVFRRHEVPGNFDNVLEIKDDDLVVR